MFKLKINTNNYNIIKVYGGVNRNNQTIAIKAKKVSRESDTFNMLSNMQFREEYECLTRMNHQNVVKCLGIEHDGNDIVGLVMEQVKGISLSRLIKKYSKIDEIMIKIYMKQIVEGISYIHSKNIIHRYDFNLFDIIHLFVNNLKY